MAGLSDRMDTLLTKQRSLQRKMPFLSNVIFLPLFLWWFGSLTFFTGAASLLLAFVAGRIWLVIHAQWAQLSLYGRDFESFYKDLDEAILLEKQAKVASKAPAPNGPYKGTFAYDVDVIERSESTSSYKDSPIYKWLIVRGADGVVKKFEFDGIINLAGMKPTDTLKIPENAFVLQPGIIYKFIGEIPQAPIAP